jgi:hypothetical protein
VKSSIRNKLVTLGQQVFASMAIGLVLFIVFREIARYSLSAESADTLDSPLFLNLLALVAFPFVRKFMTTSGEKTG